MGGCGVVGAEPRVQDLFDAALKAHANAYAPYSGFPVAAAIRTGSGAVYCGVNVENAAFPVGVCAEAGAIAAMVLAGERMISEVLILGNGPALVTPCGACRQRIFEFAGSGDPAVHVASPEGVRASFTIRMLLPQAFGPSIEKLKP